MRGRSRPASWGTIAGGAAVALVVLVASAAALSPPTPAPTPQRVLDACADADGDGELTITDGVHVLRAASELPSPCDPFHCDVDGNGAISVTDGVGVLARAAGIRRFGFYDCPVASTVRDLSAFATFDFERQPGFGFCPPDGEILRAHVDRRTDGRFLVRLGLAILRPAGDPSCVGQFGAPSDPCVAEVEQPDRVLDAVDLADVLTAFAAVRTYDARDPECALIVSDPCVIGSVRWDATQFTDYTCGLHRVDHATIDAIAAALDPLFIRAPDEP